MPPTPGFASPSAAARRRSRRELVVLACVGSTVVAVGQDELFGPMPAITTTSRSAVPSVGGADSYVPCGLWSCLFLFGVSFLPRSLNAVNEL